MNRKLLATVFVTILVCMLGLSFKAQRVEASETIYIMSNGTVVGTDKITNENNVTYTVTGDINDSIVVERSNIIIDGDEHTLNGSWSLEYGFNLTSVSNVTIRNIKITNFSSGIYLNSSSFNIISGNNITMNLDGIELDPFSNYNSISENNVADNMGGIGLDYSCNYNSISGNNITNNGCGIWLDSSSNNIIIENTIKNSFRGIEIGNSSSNILYHNNIMNNTDQVYDDSWYFTDLPLSTSVWDNGFEGNYWSNYTGLDSNHNGIGDTEHTVYTNNTDHYPLMGMFSDFNATSEYHVQTVCNSTISDFRFNGTAISFDVTGDNGTTGFCRICIPTALMNTPFKVYVNGTEFSFNLLQCSNETCSYLYFNYTHSTQEVTIIPEFPSFLILPLFMIATLLSVIAYKRKKSK